MHLNWCLMSAEHSTSCQLSNEFNFTVSMTRELATKLKRATPLGLSNLDAGPRQALKFEIGEVICRMSYKDALVVQSVIQGALKRLQTTNGPAKNITPRDEHVEEGGCEFRKKL